jgi:protein-S-isoprenylcysteine O-methyltransferase Ste14
MGTSTLRILGYAAMAAVTFPLLWLNYVRPDFYWGAIAYVFVGRLIYVGYVGYSLPRARPDPAEPDASVEKRYARFRIISWLTMHNDASAHITLAIVTRGTMPLGIPDWAVYTLGGVMILAGHGMKTWAAASIGDAGYFWRDAFFPPTDAVASVAGPYRFVRNPMYGIGYLHAYGLGVLFQSWYSLCGAAYAQIAIYVFLWLIEKPNFRRIYGGLKPAPAG